MNVPVMKGGRRKMAAAGKELLVGLPVELAMACLARLPCGVHPLARCVSRSWRDALDPTTLDPLRRKMGLCETRVIMCTRPNPDRAELCCWMIDPVLRRVEPIPAPPPRAFFSLYPPPYRFVWRIFGCSASSVALATNGPDAFTFDARQARGRGTWWGPLRMQEGNRWGYCAAASRDGFVYVAGGYVNRDPTSPLYMRKQLLRSAEKFDLKKPQQSWERLPAPMKAPRAYGGLITLQDGRFCAMGGQTSVHTEGANLRGEIDRRGCVRLPVNEGEAWDPVTLQWSTVHQLPMHWASATRIEDKIYKIIYPIDRNKRGTLCQLLDGGATLKIGTLPIADRLVKRVDFAGYDVLVYSGHKLYISSFRNNIPLCWTWTSLPFEPTLFIDLAAVTI